MKIRESIFADEVRMQRAGTLLAEGYTAHAATDAQGRVRRIPDVVRRALGGGRNSETEREML